MRGCRWRRIDPEIVTCRSASGGYGGGLRRLRFASLVVGLAAVYLAVLLSLGAITASAQTPAPDPAPLPPPPAPAPVPASSPPATVSPSHQGPTKTRSAKKRHAKTPRPRPVYTVPFHAPFAEIGRASTVQKLPLSAEAPLRKVSSTGDASGTLTMALLVVCAVALFSIPLALAPERILGRVSTRAVENRAELACGGFVVFLGVAVGLLAVLVGS